MYRTYETAADRELGGSLEDFIGDGEEENTTEAPANDPLGRLKGVFGAQEEEEEDPTEEDEEEGEADDTGEDAPSTGDPELDAYLAGGGTDIRAFYAEKFGQTKAEEAKDDEPDPAIQQLEAEKTRIKGLLKENAAAIREATRLGLDDKLDGLFDDQIGLNAQMSRLGVREAQIQQMQGERLVGRVFTEYESEARTLLRSDWGLDASDDDLQYIRQGMSQWVTGESAQYFRDPNVRKHFTQSLLYERLKGRAGKRTATTRQPERKMGSGPSGTTTRRVSSGGSKDNIPRTLQEGIAFLRDGTRPNAKKGGR